MVRRFWFLLLSGDGGDVVVLRASDGYNKYFPEIGPVHSVASFVTKRREASSAAALLARVAEAEGIFLAGSGQWNYMSRWKATPRNRAIDDALARGVPVGGTSARLEVLGEFPFSAEHDLVASAEALANPFHPKVTIETNLLHFAQMKGFITGNHFSRRDRMRRLPVWLARLRAVRNNAVRGIGIDEATAVLVDLAARARVVGQGCAWIVRQRGAAGRTFAGEPLDGADFSVCRLPAGIAFEWSSTQATGSIYGSPF